MSLVVVPDSDGPGCAPDAAGGSGPVDASGQFQVTYQVLGTCGGRADLDPAAGEGPRWRTVSDNVRYEASFADPNPVVPLALVPAAGDPRNEYRLSGAVFDDVDGDGVRQATEPGLPGVGYRVVNGCSPDGTPDQPGTTGDDGRYAAGAVSDDATCRFVVTVQNVLLPDGRTVVVDSSGERTLSVDLSADAPVAVQDVPAQVDAGPGAGYLATVTASAFDDVDGDGARDDAEPAVPGVALAVALDGEVPGCGGSSGVDPEPTDADGRLVTELSLTGPCTGSVTVGAGEPWAPSTGAVPTYAVSAEQPEVTVEVPLVRVAAATERLQGSVYVSPDGRRWRPSDGSTLGRDGVAVTLTPSGCETTGPVSTGTGRGGYWEAEVDAACTWQVAYTDPDDLVAVVEGSRSTVRGPGDTTWVTYGFTVTPPTAEPADTHTGTVWLDLDGNGRYDGPNRDPGVDGVTVVLTPSAGCADRTVMTTVTFANGFWRIDTPRCDHVVTYRGLPGFGRVTVTSSPSGDATDVVHADTEGFDGIYGRLELAYQPDAAT